ncbi:MAG: glycosyltransferase [Rhodocyclaceae bacterium]
MPVEETRPAAAGSATTAGTPALPGRKGSAAEGALYLRVGSGKSAVPGFVTVDRHGGADILADPARGLPFPDSSVGGIYSGDFIEHLSQPQIFAFLRECRRVLAPGARVRIATQDLDELARQYVEDDWRRDRLAQDGLQWISNRAEYLNLRMREQGRRWIPNGEALIQMARRCGLERPQRCPINASTQPMFRALETGTDSTLVLEFDKPVPPPVGQPLVSIVIPAFRPDFLEQCLRSALDQTYANLEILVLDDRPDGDIEKIVRSAGSRDSRVSYVRNDPPLGEAASLTKGCRLARGEFIKPLYDDDVLLPHAVESLLCAFRSMPDARLAAGQRWPIDGKGDRLDPGLLGPALSDRPGRVRGEAVIAGFAARGANNVGEPTVMLLRRRDALDIDEPDVMSLFGRPGVGIGDIVLMTHLLSRGDLAYVAAPVSLFRLHPGQTQAQEGFRPAALESWEYFRQQVARLGMRLPGADPATRPAPQGRGAAPTGKKRCLPGNEESAGRPYRDWRAKRSLQEIDGELFAERMMLRWHVRPTFHVVLVLRAGQQALLADTMDSIMAQFYPDWHLDIIAPFAAPDPAFNEIDKLCWIEAHSPAEKARAVDGLGTAASDWLWLLPAGARFEPHAMLRCGDYVNLREDWRLIYSDDDRIGPAGEFDEPRFKPDFNLDLLRSTDYVGPCLIRADALAKAGGYPVLEGSETYDATLRILDTHGERSIGHIADVLVHLPASGPPADCEASDREALARHLARAGVQASVREGYAPGTHRVVYARSGDPLVSIVIPNHDKLEFLQPCVESILDRTTYPRYEVLIVDNQSTDPDLLEYYRELRGRHAQRVRVLAYDAPFNFAAINNLAARQARGEYLLLLNNDTEILQADWLERLLSHGQRPEVGVVGARLIYPETGKLQHAGVVLGMKANDVADHPFSGALSWSEAGYMNRAQVDQNYSAVTAACMLLRRELYLQVGGMDETRLTVLFNDVDLCLRIGQAGYKIVWTPYATLVHHGSSSLREEAADPMKNALNAERARQERAAMMERWLPLLANDPAYNPHLSLQPPGYRVENTVVIDWDTNFHDRPRILGTPSAGGPGEYRMNAPFRALSRAGLAQCDVVQTEKMFRTRILSPVELERAKPDSLVLHAVFDDMQRQALEQYRRFNPDVLRILTFDDLISRIPDGNPFSRIYRGAKPRLRKALALCDRALVTTEPLAQLCRPMIEDVRVVPNRLERAVWGGVRSLRRQGNRARVGWAGAQQHAGDLAVIAEVVRATAHEVDWVFFGMCPEELRPHVREFHDFVLSFQDYVSRLAGLNLDLAVAPLEHHPFNEAKSNLRLLEYGIMGWPVVCTDIHPYRDAPVERVPNEPQAWIDAIRERVHDLDAAEREGDRLKAWVQQNFMLEDHLDEWMRALLR